MKILMTKCRTNSDSAWNTFFWLLLNFENVINFGHLRTLWKVQWQTFFPIKIPLFRSWYFYFDTYVKFFLHCENLIDYNPKNSMKRRIVQILTKSNSMIWNTSTLITISKFFSILKTSQIIGPQGQNEALNKKILAKLDFMVRNTFILITISILLKFRSLMDHKPLGVLGRWLNENFRKSGFYGLKYFYSDAHVSNLKDWRNIPS